MTLGCNSLGKYCGELNLTYYTTYDKSPDSPNNNLYYIRNSRLINTSECGEDQSNPNIPARFISEKFKRITGKDKIVCRQQHKSEQIEFSAGKCVIQTNLMPTLVGVEKEANVSLRERIEIIPFPKSFISDKELVEREPDKYGLKDVNLKERLSSDEYKLVFITLLMESYRSYLTEELIPSKAAEAAKMEYFGINYNLVKGWLNQTIQKIESANKQPSSLPTIKINELFDAYNEQSERPIKSPDFKKYMAMIYSKSNKNTEYGISLIDGYPVLRGYKWLGEE
jgi:phage/plasmid-associated DNA primase